MSLKLNPAEFKQLTDTGKVTVEVEVDTKYLSYSAHVGKFVVDSSCAVEFPVAYNGVEFSNVLRFCKDEEMSCFVFAPVPSVGSNALAESTVNLHVAEVIVTDVGVVAPISFSDNWKWKISVAIAGYN